MNWAIGSELGLTPRIPQHARPFRSGAFVDLLSISGRENDGGKRLVVIGRSDILQPQRLARPLSGTIFRRPPGYKIENGSEIRIDRIAVALGLARPKRFAPGADLAAGLNAAKDL